jgi:hypothetical protein
MAHGARQRLVWELLPEMKSCNGCTACCVAFDIPELDKKKGEPCPWQDNGCTNYVERPQRCRIFSCLYQQEFLGFGDMFPPKVGFFAGFNVTTSTLDVYPNPQQRDKWKRFLPRLRRLGQKLPVMVVSPEAVHPLGEKAKLVKIVR